MFAGSTVTHRRFNVEEYHRLAEVGILGEDDRVELIEGALLEMSPIGSRHAGIVTKLHRLLERRVGDAAIVWEQNPIILGDGSEPQPDLVLLQPRADFYTGAHPRAADVLLVVEVADTSLTYDREVKLPLYARHGIPEAWLVDLRADRVELHQLPAAEGYQRILRPGRPGVLPLPGLPGLAVDLEALLAS